MASPETVLDIKNLSVAFGAQTVVNGLNLTVGQGQTVGLVGESGSGKSVTSLAIMQLLQKPLGNITGGDILFYDTPDTPTNLATLTDAQMRHYRGNKIAMIFQEPMTSLNPVLTCGYQVAEALILHKGLSRKQAKARTIELFNEVKLPRPAAIFDAYPHQISGGQKQRVMIAMAISCNPKLLIADEPTTALDVTVQKQIIDLLGKLQEQHKMGIIFISHDLGVVHDIAHNVSVMYRSRLVEAAPAEELFANPTHPYTKGLLACRPPVDVRLSRLPVVADFMNTLPDGTYKETGLTIGALKEQLTIPDTTIHNSTQPLLSVEGLKVYFPLEKNFWGKPTAFVKAVDDVSFTIAPSETLGLVGESGCGKTTLGRAILRLVEPTAGKVLFNGNDVFALNGEAMRKLRKDIQIVFQDPYSSLNPRLTVGDAIAEPMLVHKLATNAQAKDRTAELLEKVGLSADIYNRYPHQFSGGQRQRVCIARALALNPKFIVCDESVSALDVSVQAQVLNLLNNLKQEFGFTYLFITHDMSVVRFMADRVLVMSKGKIEEIAPTAQLFNSPKSDYTRQLIEAIPGRR